MLLEELIREMTTAAGISGVNQNLFSSFIKRPKATCGVCGSAKKKKKKKRKRNKKTDKQVKKKNNNRRNKE